LEIPWQTNKKIKTFAVKHKSTPKAIAFGRTNIVAHLTGPKKTKGNIAQARLKQVCFSKTLKANKNFASIIEARMSTLKF